MSITSQTLSWPVGRRSMSSTLRRRPCLSDDIDGSAGAAPTEFAGGGHQPSSDRLGLWSGPFNLDAECQGRRLSETALFPERLPYRLRGVRRDVETAARLSLIRRSWDHRRMTIAAVSLGSFQTWGGIRGIAGSSKLNARGGERRRAALPSFPVSFRALTGLERDSQKSDDILSGRDVAFWGQSVATSSSMGADGSADPVKWTNPEVGAWWMNP